MFQDVKQKELEMVNGGLSFAEASTMERSVAASSVMALPGIVNEAVALPGICVVQSAREYLDSHSRRLCPCYGGNWTIGCTKTVNPPPAPPPDDAQIFA